MASIFDRVIDYKDSDKVAIYFKKHNITYKKLYKNVLRMSNYFVNIGIKKGDIVTLVLPNIPTCVYALYALNYIGAKVSILHFLTRFKAIVDKMDVLKSKYVILPETLIDGSNDYIVKNDKKFILVNPFKYHSWLKRLVYYFKKPSIKKSKNIFNLDEFTNTRVELTTFNNFEKNETSFFIHSGGTTDVPKIVELSNEALEGISINLFNGLSSENNKTLAVLPIFHCYGLCVGIHSFLSIHASIYLMDKFSPSEVISGINSGKINMIIAIPAMMKKIMEDRHFKKCKIENLGECFVGADSLNTTLIKEFNKLVRFKKTNAKIYEGYGLTETSSVVIVNTKSNYKLGSFGKPTANIDVIILDDDNNIVKANEIGEICIAGNTLMNGYYNNPEATRDSFINIDGKKYLRTGDIGYIDKEGFVFFKERKKRIFKISGVTIYPREIENLVLKFDNIIKDASLELINDDKGKPSLILFVVKRNSNDDESEIIELIMDKIKKNFIKYNWPGRIVFLDNIPKTAAGKVNHNMLISIIE